MRGGSTYQKKEGPGGLGETKKTKQMDPCYVFVKDIQKTEEKKPQKPKRKLPLMILLILVLLTKTTISIPKHIVKFWKNECGGTPIQEFIGLRLKVYSLLYDAKELTWACRM